MPRPNEGWKLREPKPGKRYWTVRFIGPDGTRHELGTGHTSKPEAAAAAPGLVAAYQAAGRPPKRPRGDRAPVGMGCSVGEDGAQWLSAIATTIDISTRRWYARLFSQLFVPYFKTRLGLSEPGAIGRFINWRLGRVQAVTVEKERYVLGAFLRWCVDEGKLLALPTIPELPSRAYGTRAKNAKSLPVSCSPEEIRAIIAALPEYSEPRKLKPGTPAKWARGFPIRARFVVAYEQSLRPKVLDTLRYPDHYQPGATGITIEAMNDKGRYQRLMPITDVARAALDSVCPTSPGLIFGKHAYRKALKRAAKRVLPPDRAKDFKAYDFRGNRATHWLDEGAALTAVQEMMGHASVTTTAGYIKPSQRAAEALIAKSNTPKRAKRRVG